MSQGFVSGSNIPLPLAVGSGGTGVTTSTGSGSNVLNTSPTIITPNIVGVTDGSSAAAGNVGQLLSSIILLASSIPIGNATATNLTSLSLSAGDWNVWGNLTFILAGSCNDLIGWISSTSATLENPAHSSNTGIVTTITGNPGFTVPQRTFSLTSPTTIYLSGYASIVSSTVIFCGAIYARRIR